MDTIMREFVNLQIPDLLLTVHHSELLEQDARVVDGYYLVVYAVH